MSVLAPVLGGIGDFLTVVAGGFLAWDAVRGEKHFARMQNITSAMQHPTMRGVLVEIDGNAIRGPEDVERIFVKRTSRNAKIGFVLLLVGFAFLFGCRMTEIIELLYN